MRVSVMASLGGGEKSGNLVAIDNFVIKMITNDSREVTELVGQEPETDIEDEVGLAADALPLGLAGKFKIPIMPLFNI